MDIAAYNRLYLSSSIYAFTRTNYIRDELSDISAFQYAYISDFIVIEFPNYAYRQ